MYYLILFNFKIYISDINSIFLFINICFGFGITATHVSLNSQGFHFLERSKINLITSTAGFWSAGALATSIVSGLLVGHIGLVTHITFLAAAIYICMFALIIKLKPVLLESNRNSDHDYSIKEIFTGFRIDWPVSLGMACAVYLEFCVGDWGTIFTKERLDVSGGLSAAPFIVFTAMMIIGRLMVHRFSIEIHLLVRRAVLVAGLGFGIPILIATHLSPAMKWWSYALFILGFSLAGLGSSYIGPSFLNIANSRINLPPSIVIGQVSAVNATLAWILKQLVAFLAQIVGLQIALTIPALMIISVGVFARVFKPTPAK